ncbi:MAG: DEAD/DEAH box helicase, partial [Methylococcales bacterium]
MLIEVPNIQSFNQLGLTEPVLKALNDVGYETPSPIQAQAIPPLLAGQDVLGQAQTGTGKTAAFACPLLSRLEIERLEPQVLVLTPTRELAIQVAEAFQGYAAHIKGFHVMPIYGGQDYSLQIRQLKRGVHVVVGTPGRVMDHMRRGTLVLKGLNALVLDEADEMLRMGFIEDVEWILEQTPSTRQTALFSATIPDTIRRIAEKHLKSPQNITVKVKTKTADTIRQRYWMVSGVHKLDALTRILEAEAFEGMIIFVRTRNATLELAEKLEARGYSSAALNGDIPQKIREQTVDRLKSGKLDILVATDVAARGLDVDRISHVINFDIPYDSEAYIHRIGRTGRMGRKGEAILFIAPREKYLLKVIEQSTRQKIDMMELPSTEFINDKRMGRFTQRITDTLANDELDFYQQLLEKYQREHNIPAIEIAAALAKLVQGEEPLLLKYKPEITNRETDKRPHGTDKRPARADVHERAGRPIRTERFRMEVGHSHGVKPGTIVRMLAGEMGIETQLIGRIDIQDHYTTVDLLEGIPNEV